MALIPCPACDHQISEMAAACPKCGHPSAGAAQAARPGAPSRPARAITIEQTSKIYKLGQLAGALMVCAGAVACSAQAPSASAGLFIVGLFIFIGSRLGAWWSNG